MSDYPYPDPPPSEATKKQIAALDSELSRTQDPEHRWRLFSQIQHLLWGDSWREKFKEFLHDPRYAKIYRRWTS